MFKEVADVQTADMLNLPVPKANFQNIAVKPSKLQIEMVKELSERARLVQAQKIDPTVDNMLKITTDGRKIGLDQRLANPMLPDDPGSKVNACIDNIYRIWSDTQAKRLTQLVFCDFSTPNTDGRFNVYDDIKTKLLMRGVPENEIAFIHDAKTEAKKKELFSKVRKGQVRILLGSTFKLGSGTNVQDLLYASHDLDCPWRPSDLEQRAGRIVRQGNMNNEVNIYRYVTEGTFDAYLWQTIENKQKFIAQIMTSKSPVRTCADVDETMLSYAEIKALCAGNPMIKEKMDLDVEVARLRLLKADHRSQHYRLEDDLLKHFPESIKRTKEQIEGFKKDVALIAENTLADSEAFAPMVIGGITYTEKEKAGDALLNACKNITSIEPVKIGNYRGLTMHITFDTHNKIYKAILKNNMRYTSDLGTSSLGNITRIDNSLNNMPSRLRSCEAQLENLYQQVKEAEQELQKPFVYEQELAAKSMRLDMLDAELSIGNNREQPISDSEEAAAKEERLSAKQIKPSILKSLKESVTGSSPVGKPSKANDVCI